MLGSFLGVGAEGLAESRAPHLEVNIKLLLTVRSASKFRV